MKQIITILIVILSFGIKLYSQTNDWCITGQIIDTESNSPIPFAHVATVDYKKAVITDDNGFFKLCNIVGDTASIIIHHTSYIVKNQKILKTDPLNIQILLTIKDYEQKEITVTSNIGSNLASYIPGKQMITKNDILLTPGLLGSPDVVRTLQLLPGIQAVNDGSSGIYVRGGSPGQNYILLDDIELMNPSHIMGLYSVFNPLLTQNVELYKGNAPLHQSEKLASSIIVNTRNSTNPNSKWEGSVGNIATNLTYNTISKNNKWYFSCGMRRSYLELIKLASKPLFKKENNYFENNNYNFYDFNGKLRYSDKKNELTASWYLGQDHYLMQQNKTNINVEMQWGNKGAAFVWNHHISPKLSIKSTFNLTDYTTQLNLKVLNEILSFATQYKHYRLRSDVLYEHKKHQLRIGLSSTLFDVTPQKLSIATYSDSRNVTNSYSSNSSKLYISDYFKISDKWSSYFGFGIEHYLLQHPNSEKNVNIIEPLKDYSTWNWNSIYTLNYKVSNYNSIKGSYSYTAQAIHLASVASIPLPSDILMPATKKLPHENGHQFTIGYFSQLQPTNWQLGIEGYVKKIENQLLLKVNINNETIPNFDDNFYKGDGLAYGTELYIKNNIRKFHSSTSYTLGWSKQKFPLINDGQWFDAKYDRRHDLNILVTYLLNKRIDFGMVFLFATGNTATLPTGRYWLMGQISNDYEGVNNYRMPSYHRLDLSVNYHLKSKLFTESTLNLSIINIYNHSNPYFIYYHISKGVKSYDIAIKAKQVSLFPIMPSISWQFKF